jgi:uncharacterized membrane protein
MKGATHEKNDYTRKENLTIGKSVMIVGSGVSMAIVIAFAETFVLSMAARARAARSRINSWVF